MNLMNYHLYANAATMNQVMAEDAGAAELRNPVFYIRTEYSRGRLQQLADRMARRWKDFWSTCREKELCRRMLIARAVATRV